MSKEIVVDVYPDGTLSIEINGVVGTGCEKILKELSQRGLGKITKHVKKPEYSQVERTQTSTNRIRR